jgi:peptidoglycan/xylan/chitin deacetylase (PgdA/CDA1 family)
MLNALSIDVEDYYHVSAFESVVRYEVWDSCVSRVVGNTCRLLDLLDERETKATFFVLGWVAERKPQLVRLISARGHEVGSHGYSHKRIHNQSPAEFLAETMKAKRTLE